MKSFKIYIIFVLIIYLVTSSSVEAQILLRDDFQKTQDHWYWRADGNQSKPTVEDGVLRLQLKDAIDTTYCNTEIYDPTEPYSVGTHARIRLKTSEIHHGSRGWGFWDGDLNIPAIAYDFDVAWVMQQGSHINDPNFRWFLFGVDGDTLYNKNSLSLSGLVNETGWNTYKIIWQNDKVGFYVDDKVIYEVFEHLPDEPMRMDIWIDNRVLNLKNPINRWHNNVESSEMLVDFIEITGVDGAEIQREKYENVVLWDSPNTFPNGAEKSLWKNFNFSIPNKGETLLFITGYAESYGSENDDDLRIVIDREDFGWDTEFSLNGDALNGKGKSISIPLSLETGNHELELFTDITPFIRDIIILNQENGNILLNEEYNEKADGNKPIWKKIKLSIDPPSNVTFLISGMVSVNERLEVEIDNDSSNWNGNNLIIENPLSDVPSTILFTKYLETGDYYLKIRGEGNPSLYKIAAYGSTMLTDVAETTRSENLINISAYPNPFNNSTNLTYSTYNSSNNRIKIINILGQEIATLVDAIEPGGTHNISWEATNATSGLYFCIFETEEYYRVQKLVLTK